MILDVNLVFLPSIKNAIFQQAYNKKYAFIFLGFSNFKMIFALLIKIIAFYIQVAIIEIEVLRLD